MALRLEGKLHPLLSRTIRLILVFCALALVGLCLRPIEGPAWRDVKVGQPELKLDQVENALGQGLIIGVLGGFRAIVADFLWIRTNTIWEREDRVKLDTMIRLVQAIDPRPKFFWLNGARMTAYDVPNWRIMEEGGHDVVSDSRKREIELDQSAQAFVMLDSAMSFHPDNPVFHLERAQIYMNRLKDDAAAAKWFLSGSRLPDAPSYAARIYAELLKKQGMDSEAYAFLKQLFDELSDDPYSQKSIVFQRIQKLEDVLKIPIWQRFATNDFSEGIRESMPMFLESSELEDEQ